MLLQRFLFLFSDNRHTWLDWMDSYYHTNYLLPLVPWLNKESALTPAANSTWLSLGLSWPLLRERTTGGSRALEKGHVMDGLPIGFITCRSNFQRYLLYLAGGYNKLSSD